MAFNRFGAGGPLLPFDPLAGDLNAPSAGPQPIGPGGPASPFAPSGPVMDPLAAALPWGGSSLPSQPLVPPTPSLQPMDRLSQVMEVINQTPGLSLPSLAPMQNVMGVRANKRKQRM